MSSNEVTTESTLDEIKVQLSSLAVLLKAGFAIGTLIFMIFVVFLGLGASESSYEITNQMVFFYMFLSYSGGIGGILSIILLQHPNVLVRAIFILCLLLFPIVLEFGIL